MIKIRDDSKALITENVERTKVKEEGPEESEHTFLADG